MSYIDSELTEKMLTKATIEQLKNALLKADYDVTTTSMQLMAYHGGFFTNGKMSYITITDYGDYRECVDKETAKGILCKPNHGVLARIINEAENS